MSLQAPLTIEMIPRSSWGYNLRKVVSKETWGALKEIVFNNLEPEPMCMICSQELSFDWELHETWEFDRKSRIQRLINLLALCPDCHAVKHFGLTAKQGNIDKAISHLKLVNNWNDEQVLKHISIATKEWEENSKLNYHLDISFAEKLIPITRIHMKWLEEKIGIPTNKYEAILWAKELLNDNDFLLIDTETTGLLTKQKAEVIQISIVSSKQKILFNQLIRPKYKIPKSITNYNGISNEEVKACHSFDELHEEIKDAINGNRLIAFNSKFDSEILNRTCDLYKLPHFEAKWECAMKAYRAYCNFPRSGCHLPMASHNALVDCMATMRLIIAMANEGNPYDLIEYPAPWLK